MAVGTASYPTSLPTADSMFRTANSPTTTTLNGGITSGDTSIVLTSASAYTASGAIKIDSEIIYYSSKSVNTLTVSTRGADGTSAASHANGATVRMVAISRMHQIHNDEIIALCTKLGTGSSTAITNSVMAGTAAGVSSWTATPTIDRQYVAPSALAFDLIGNAVAVGAWYQTSADVSISTGKIYDIIRMSKNDAGYSVFDLAGTATMAGLDFELQSKSTSGSGSAVHGIIGAVSNKSPNTMKGVYGRAIGETGCTGTVIGLVGAVSTVSGTTAWATQIAGSDDTDFAIRIHADNLTSANFNGGIEYDKNVRMETGGSFFRAYQTAAHAGDFLSYLTQADVPLFKVDKDGVVGLTGLANGQILNVQTLTELTTIAAAPTTDTAIQIPAFALVLSVDVRVTVVIPTAATFTVTGVTTGAFNTGTSVSTAANTTDKGTKAGAFYSATTQSIRITPNLTPAANTGRVRVTIRYIDVTAATS